MNQNDQKSPMSNIESQWAITSYAEVKWPAVRLNEQK